MTTDLPSTKKQVLDIILRSSEKITPAKLQRLIFEKFALNRKESKTLIKSLIADEAITYTYHFGNTYLERSFGRPVRISSKIILVPPVRTCPRKPGDVVVIIEGGASFGSGAHPTTRLSLKAIEFVMTQHPFSKDLNPICLDIGTGSGVLVIASVKLGMRFGKGLDIDPNALAEAEHNVALNGLSDCIRIENASLSGLTGRYSLITANLRYPTLTKIKKEITRLSAEEGVLVLSGFRPEEQKDIERVYAGFRFQRIFTAKENEWACMALKKAD